MESDDTFVARMPDDERLSDEKRLLCSLYGMQLLKTTCPLPCKSGYQHEIGMRYAFNIFIASYCIYEEQDCNHYIVIQMIMYRKTESIP